MRTENQIHRIDQLQDAFSAFNQLSRNLSDSYHDLENQVAHLTTELAKARDARLKTLIEKEQLAGRLQTLLETLPGGVVVVNGEGTIVEHNKAAGTLLNRRLVGENWQCVVDGVFEADCDNPQERTLKDGKVIGLSVRSLGDEPGQIVLLTDVTEIRYLQGMSEQQKRLSTMGKTLASIAHQIRTPLTTAMLYASNLKKSQLSEQQRVKFAHKLSERLQHLEQQVTDMLIFAKDGEFLTEQVSLKALINNLRGLVEGLLVDSEVEFVVRNNSDVDLFLANEKALTGALTNLLTNAFEAAGGAGAVHLEFVDDGDENLLITVSDEGPGIPEQLRTKIFEPFFTTRVNGTGLGLSVVDRVARAHHGKVWCEPSIAGGSRFSFSLPIRSKTDLLPSGFSGGSISGTKE